MANERRLIDANALLFTTLTDGGYWTVDVVYKRDILNAATVDAVEAVFCKDCIHMTIEQGLRYCNVWERFNGVGDGGYCNYGEKRESGTQPQREVSE